MTNHGGKRKGAGRPLKEDEPMKRKNVTLPPSHIEELKKIGDGNLSEGIRRLVKKHFGEES